jgi:hypothetical protein
VKCLASRSVQREAVPMKVEVWVHADGEGSVPADGLERVRIALGDSCVGISGLPGRWSVGVVVSDADSLQEGARIARVQVQAAATAAGLPNWPISHGDATSERWSLGPLKKQSRMSWGTATATVERGGGTAGVREPRRPIPSPPSLATERDPDE